MTHPAPAKQGFADPGGGWAAALRGLPPFRRAFAGTAARPQGLCRSAEAWFRPGGSGPADRGGRATDQSLEHSLKDPIDLP